MSPAERKNWVEAGREHLGREESELDSRHVAFPVPTRESRANSPKVSQTPAGAREKDLVLLNIQVEDKVSLRLL